MRRMLIAAMLALASPMAAQVCAPTATARGGGVFTLFVDSVAQPGTHTAERAALTRALGLYRADSTRVVEYEQLYRVRIGGCAGWRRTDTVTVQLPGRVDTLTVIEQVTVVVTDTVVRVDTLVVRDTVPPIVPPPPPPPVDTTPVPPPVDTSPPVTPPPPPPPPAAVTGYWSDAWRAGWLTNRSHPWWQLIDGNCSGARYGDTGLWCAIVYQVTGDTVAGRKAVTTALNANPQEANANTRREQHIEFAMLYGALRPLLTPAEDLTWRARLDRWAEIALAINTAQYVGGTRTNDEDQLLGVTLGMQCADRMTGSNWTARIANLITATNHAIDVAAGGELAESYAYNAGSSVLVAMGLACLPDGTYPNGARFLAHRAQYLPFSVTPDLRQKQQWWDEEHPRDFTGRLFRDMTGWVAYAGLTGNPNTERLIQDVAARYGWTGYATAEPWARGFLFWWPGKVTPAPNPVRGSHVATGRGHLYVLTDSASVQLTASNRTFEDHEWAWLSNVSIYRAGEWAITSPRAYSQWPAFKGEGSNGISLSGLGAMANRGMTWADSGTGWWAIAGQTRGPLYDAGYYDPPPAYVQAANRVALYTEVPGWSVVITRDSVAMSNPVTLPKFARYRTSPNNHQAWLTAGNGLASTIWHHQVNPIVSGQVVSWQTAGGQAVRVHLFADAPVTTTVTPQAGMGGPAASELKWHTSSSTNAPVLWSVVLVGRGTPPTVARSGDTITVGGKAFTITSAGVR